MRFKPTILLFCFANLFAEVHATNWLVGPTRPYPVPSAVASLVADGDTVSIDAGLYMGDVAKWYANSLLLRRVGNGYAHLDAGGNNAEGKAIWVIKGADCIVEGIEFSGCQVPDNNGAGIRQEGKNLTLRHCYFHHNEMGILTSNDGVSDYTFWSCEFAENGYGDGYSHNVYVGHVNSLTMFYCYSHDSKVGHLVKSRASHNYLYYNRLTGENGDGSYEIDLPNGGEAILIGNIIEQSPNSQNGGMVSFGLEGATNPKQDLVLLNNTLVNDRFDGRFVQFSDGTDLVQLANNLFLGPGQLLQGSTANLDTTHNIHHLNIADGMLTAPGMFDYRPLANAPCVDAGVDVIFYGGENLMPQFQYVHPLAYQPRQTKGVSTDIGAYEFEPEVSAVNQRTAGEGFKISPNPALGDRLNLAFNLALPKPTPLRLVDSWGRTALAAQIPQGENRFELELNNCPPGSYLIDIEGFVKQIFIKI
jgi:hypothetical protein